MTQASNPQIRLRRLARWSLICSLVACFICQVFSNTEKVEMKTVRFDVPEGKATKTLKEAALQANVDIVFSGRVVRGIRTVALKGEYVAQGAFDIMLAGTSIAVSRHEKSGVYIVENVEGGEGLAQTNENKRNFGSFLAGIFGGAESEMGESYDEQAESVYELSPFEVSIDPGNGLYGINNSSSGTRIAAVVKELPFTLDILTTDYLDDFHMADPSNALGEVSNVSFGNPNTGAGGGNLIRGFTQWYGLRDGFFRNGVVGKTMVDRVEILKGPYAAIYGRGEPGGIVNYIPKVAVYGSKSGETMLQYGQNNTYRIQVEQNVPLADRTALLVAASYFEREFDQEFSYERSRNIGALMRHRLTDKDELFFDYEKMMRRNNRGHGIPILRMDSESSAVYDGIALSGDQYLGLWGEDFVENYGNINVRGPYTWGERHVEAYSAKWLHRFSDRVNLRVSYYNQIQDQPYNFASYGSNEIRVDENLEFVRWGNHAEPLHQEQNAGGRGVNVDLNVEWRVGESKHATLITYDNTFTDGDILELAPAYSQAAQTLNGSLMDVYRDWGNYSLATHPELYNKLRRNDFTHIAVEGLFLMHRARFFDDKLKLMLGVRYDESATTMTEKEDPADARRITGRNETIADDTTYNVGVNYSLSPRAIAYASYATSFNPKGNFYSHGDAAPMPNESGEGLEFGIRASLFNDRIDAGLNYYHIERRNMKMSNPEWMPEAFNSDGYLNIPSEGDLDRNGLNPLTSAQAKAYRDAYRYSVPEDIPSGVDQVHGYEFFANGRVTENLSFRASLGTANTEYVVSGFPFLVGQEFRGVPRWTHALSAKYKITNGSFEGLGFALSYNGQDDHREENRDWRNDSDRRWYMRTDEIRNLRLAASYNWKTGERSHKLAVSVSNALSQKGIRLGGYLIEGRNIQASYTVKY